MNKNVITLFGGDEAEALRVVEPLHVSGCSHLESPFRAAFRRFKPQFIVSLWQTTELPPTQPRDRRANSGKSLNFACLSPPPPSPPRPLISSRRRRGALCRSGPGGNLWRGRLF